MAAYYDEVLRALGVYPLNQHFDRSWTAHVAVKSALYEAESQMQAAAAQRAEDNIHIEITRLKVILPYTLAELGPLCPHISAGVCVVGQGEYPHQHHKSQNIMACLLQSDHMYRGE